MREKRLLIVAVGVLVLTVLFLSQVSVAPTVFAKGGMAPKISWAPSLVTATLAAGSTYSTTVVFSSTVDLNNVTLRLTRSFKGAASVTPSAFASITAGTPYTVEIDFTAPTNARRTSYGGVLTVRNNKRAYASPLPLLFQVQR
jgi:uncharacterized membrane protein